LFQNLEMLRVCRRSRLLLWRLNFR